MFGYDTRLGPEANRGRRLPWHALVQLGLKERTGETAGSQLFHKSSGPVANHPYTFAIAPRG